MIAVTQFISQQNKPFCRHLAFLTKQSEISKFNLYTAMQNKKRPIAVGSHINK